MLAALVLATSLCAVHHKHKNDVPATRSMLQNGLFEVSVSLEVQRLLVRSTMLPRSGLDICA